MVINHLLTGMILQVGDGFKHFCLIVIPILGELIRTDGHIVQMGCFKHQLDDGSWFPSRRKVLLRFIWGCNFRSPWMNTFVGLRLYFTLYHGKSPLNHLLEDIFDFFQPP